MDHKQFVQEAERDLAKADLEDIVKAFNDSFKDWEDFHSFGANFRFVYAEGTGRKSLQVSDLEPTIHCNSPVTQEQLKKAGDTIDAALMAALEPDETDEVPAFPPTGDAPIFTPPEIAVADTESTAKFPELSKLTTALEDNLKSKVRAALSHLLMSTVGENDLLLLSALGIDGRQKILDVFSEECRTLKEEFAYATSRSGGWTGAKP
jgi:hypothetical protein